MSRPTEASHETRKTLTSMTRSSPNLSNKPLVIYLISSSIQLRKVNDGRTL